MGNNKSLRQEYDQLVNIREKCKRIEYLEKEMHVQDYLSLVDEYKALKEEIKEYDNKNLIGKSDFDLLEVAVKNTYSKVPKFNKC